MKYPDLFLKRPLLVVVFLLSACAAPMNQHIRYQAAEQAQMPVDGMVV